MSKTQIAIFAFTGLLAAVPGFGQQTTQTTGQRETRSSDENFIYPNGRRADKRGTDDPDRLFSSSGRFLIGPDDTLSIVALNADEISKQWRVGATGDLVLPMVGEIHAAGLTVEEFEQALDTRLKEFILDPHVTVFVSEFRSQPVTVTGEVLNPGTSQLQGPKTLFQVLMGAGGPNDKATTVTLARRTDQGEIPLPEAKHTESGNYSVAEMSIKDVTDVRTATANLTIRPFDVVTVSREKEPRLVHITGEVARPGAVELVTLKTFSLLRLVAASGGLTHSAAAGKARIIHPGADGVPEVATVNLNRILAGKQPDRQLNPGDVVVVPSGRFAGLLQAAQMSALTTGMYILGRY
jgi:polysaccharide export outer membrane protein